MKCDPVGISDTLSNSSTSETLIDAPLTSAQYSEENIYQIDNDPIKEQAGYKSITTGIKTTNSDFVKDPTLLVTIPSTKPTVSDTVVHNLIHSFTRHGNEFETTPLQDNFVCDPVSCDKIKTTSAGNKLTRAQTMSCSRDASPSRQVFTC